MDVRRSAGGGAGSLERECVLFESVEPDSRAGADELARPGDDEDRARIARSVSGVRPPEPLHVHLGGLGGLIKVASQCRARAQALGSPASIGSAGATPVAAVSVPPCSGADMVAAVSCPGGAWWEHAGGGCVQGANKRADGAGESDALRWAATTFKEEQVREARAHSFRELIPRLIPSLTSRRDLPPRRAHTVLR